MHYVYVFDLNINAINTEENFATRNDRYSPVESKHPVAESDPEGGNTGDTPEATMIFGTPFPDVLVCAVAEWCIGRQLAIAKLVVSGLAHVEGDRAVACQDPLTLTITQRVDLAVAARTPIVRFAAAEEHVRRENTCVCWHTR